MAKIEIKSREGRREIDIFVDGTEIKDVCKAHLKLDATGLPVLELSIIAHESIWATLDDCLVKTKAVNNMLEEDTVNQEKL